MPAKLVFNLGGRACSMLDQPIDHGMNRDLAHVSEVAHL
jgi:hypothetical protein